MSVEKNNVAFSFVRKSKLFTAFVFLLQVIRLTVTTRKKTKERKTVTVVWVFTTQRTVDFDERFSFSHEIIVTSILRTLHLELKKRLTVLVSHWAAKSALSPFLVVASLRISVKFLRININGALRTY